MAPLGMKSMGGSGELIRHGVVTAAEALSYAMSLPVSVTISGIDPLPSWNRIWRLCAHFGKWTRRKCRHCASAVVLMRPKDASNSSRRRRNTTAMWVASSMDIRVPRNSLCRTAGAHNYLDTKDSVSGSLTRIEHAQAPRRVFPDRKGRSAQTRTLEDQMHGHPRGFHVK
jgi:hypothetical protein